jgi:hypothetical protein
LQFHAVCDNVLKAFIFNSSVSVALARPPFEFT